MSSSYDSALVDVALIEDPKMLMLPRGIRFLHLEALVWSKSHLTDGFIPAGALARLTDEPDPHQAAKELCRVGLWDMTDAGWRIVGFTDTQMSAKRVRDKRTFARARYDKYQQSLSPKRVSNATANEPARPAPPARKGGGQEGGGDAAGLGEPAAAALQVVEEPTAAPSRRELAKLIRETDDPAWRERYTRIFRKSFGHLYEKGVAA